MNATIQTIVSLMNERAAKVQPLYRQLNTVIRDDEKPAEWRERRERELRTEAERINGQFERLINEAVEEAIREPERAMVEGSPLTAAELAEATMVADEYRGLSSLERRGLVTDIEADLRAGRTSGARIKARAAQSLRIPLGPLAGQLIEADPAKVEARDSHVAIRALHEVAAMEPIRERLAAGLGTPAESVRIKEFASGRELRRDTPFTLQVQPGYSGPTVRSGPESPWAEPYNPELQRQQAQMERIGRDTTTPDDTAARYGSPGGTRQLTSHAPDWDAEPEAPAEPAEAPASLSRQGHREPGVTGAGGTSASANGEPARTQPDPPA